MAGRRKDFAISGPLGAEVFRTAVNADPRSLEELAREVGCHRTTLTQGLHDPGRMTLERASRLADALGFDGSVRLVRSAPDD